MKIIFVCTHYCVRRNKKICLFTVTRPTLILIADPNFFFVIKIRKLQAGQFNFYIHLWNRNWKYRNKTSEFNFYINEFVAICLPLRGSCRDVQLALPNTRSYRFLGGSKNKIKIMHVNTWETQTIFSLIVLLSNFQLMKIFQAACYTALKSL